MRKHPYFSGSNPPDRDQGGSDDCSLIFKQKPLNSPNPDALSSLAPQTKLVVRAKDSALEILTQDDIICGTIISDVAEIIKCIKQGHSYVAFVISNNGGKCVVEVRHK